VIDVTDNLLSKLKVAETERRVRDHDAPPIKSINPQASIMFARLSAIHSKDIAHQLSRFHKFDDALNFQALTTCLTRCIDPSVAQSFEYSPRPDPEIVRLFGEQLWESWNKHEEACIKNGLWRVYYDKESDLFHIRLTRRRRLSALTAIDALAQIEFLDQVNNRRLSSGKISDDDVYFALASSAEHLRFVAESTPEAWTAFTKSVGFNTAELTAYSGFLVFLGFAAEMVGHSLYYDINKLLELRDIFCEAYTCPVLTDQALKRVIDLFSLTPSLAANYLLPVPFFRIGDNYLRYEGFERIMSPVMGLLTIAIRKHDSAWSQTLGSTLAYAADTIADSLPKYPRLKVAVRRGIKNKGDVDLVLYDTVTRHMLVCEVKTVYDKHRTVHQMHRFEDFKVNTKRAVGQLRRAIALIQSGELTMSVLFGRQLMEPLRIDAMLLTWLDPVDLTIATADEDILNINFATLRFLVKRCCGDLSALVSTIFEMRNIWLVAIRRPLNLGQLEIQADLEVQVPVLDLKNEIEQLCLSSTTMDVLRLLNMYQDVSCETVPLSNNVVSYISDTRRIIMKV